MNKVFTAKWWKLLKLCTAQGLLTALLCGAALGRESSQQVLDRKITLHLTDVSFDAALGEIAHAARATFAYSPELLNVQDQITINAVNLTVREILDEIFLPRKIKYQLHPDGKTISLKKSNKPENEMSTAEENSGEAPAPQRGLLTGIVTDSNRQPLTGVSIIVKGSSQGTTTDAEGKFNINVEPDDVLVFSFIGFIPQEVTVGNQTTLVVELTEDIKNLTEVVINAGYWNVSDAERTGNISRITSKDIASQPVSNPMASLIGRMAGVYVQENSGVPGAGFNIQIRGRNSLRTDGNDPLYIIDGVPYTSSSLLQSQVYPVSLLNGPNPLSIINPQDIESIEVLKDADATAIYGSRGANGVVLITTKKGKEGKTKFDLNVTRGVGQVANRVNMLNTQQYLEMRNEAFANDGLTSGSGDFDVNGTWDQDRYTDWQDVLIGGTAQFSNAQLSLSGGSANTQFLVGAGYNRQTTVFPGDLYYQRGSAHVNLNHTSNDRKFTLSLTTNVGLENNNMADVTFQSDIYSLAPNAPALYTEDGTLNWGNGTWSNPLAQLERDYKANIQNLISNIRLGYKILPDLELKTSFGYNSIQTNEVKINPIRAKNPDDDAATGSAGFGKNVGSTWILEPQAEYKRKIFKGKLITLAGMTLQSNNQDGMYILTSGVANDVLLENIASAPAGSVTSRNSFLQYRYAALFARLNYNWNEKYILNLTARRDGSSRFGPGKQFGNFGAVGTAWIFSNEDFVKNSLTFLSFGKLRASYGTTGSDQIGNYGYLDSYGATSLQYQGPGLNPARLANPDYAWESNRKIEGGIELGLFQNQLSLSASYYRNRSSNQLVGLPLPGTTGFTSVQYNLSATVQNTGWEFDMRFTNVTTGSFVWETGFNISLPRNLLVEFPDLESSAYSSTYRVGEPLNIDLTFEYLGVDPTTGLYTFADLDESGSVTAADNLKITRTGIDFHGGIQNAIRYKGVELTFFFQLVKQTKLTYRQAFVTPGRAGNQPVDVMERWQGTDDESNVQKFSTTTAANTAYTRWRNSDAAYDDASFTRLKNVSLSWQLPSHWSSRLTIQSCRVYVQTQNLLTITKYPGLDPENRFLPPLRTITGGLQVTF